MNNQLSYTNNKKINNNKESKVDKSFTQSKLPLLRNYMYIRFLNHELKEFKNNSKFGDQVKYLARKINLSIISSKQKIKFLNQLVDILKDNKNYISSDYNTKINTVYKLHKVLEKNYSSKDSLLVVSYLLSNEQEKKKDNNLKIPKVIDNKLPLSNLIKDLLNNNIELKNISRVLQLQNKFDVDCNSLRKFVCSFVNKEKDNEKNKENNNDKNKAINDCVNEIFRLTEYEQLRLNFLDESLHHIKDSQKKLIVNSLIKLYDNYSREIFKDRQLFNIDTILLKDKELNLEYFAAINVLREMILDKPKLGIGVLTELLYNGTVSLSSNYIYNKEKSVLKKDSKKNNETINIDDLVKYYKNSEDYKISILTDKILKTYPSSQEYLKRVLSLYQTFDLTKVEINKILSQIINISENPNINCDVETLIRHIPSLYTSDYLYNGSMNFYSIFSKSYMRFLTNYNKKLPNDEKLNFYLKIGDIVKEYDNQKNIISTKNHYYKESKDTDFLSPSRLQDLRLIEGIVGNLNSIFKDYNFNESIIAIFSEKYYELGNDIDKLNLFKDSLSILHNMTKNLIFNEQDRGLILSVVHDFANGKANDFIAKNLDNHNIDFHDYIEYVINTSMLDDLSKGKLINLSKNYSIKNYNRFESAFEDDDNWRFEDDDDWGFEKNDIDVNEKGDDKFKVDLQDEGEKFIYNITQDSSKLQAEIFDNDEGESEYIEVDSVEISDLDDDSVEFLDLDGDDIFDSDIIEEDDDLVTEKEIEYNLTIIAKNHPDKFSDIVNNLNEILNIDSDNAVNFNIPDNTNLVKSLIFEISHPFLISQYAGTCLTTSIEFYYCLNDPVKYLELVKEKYLGVLSSNIKYDAEAVKNYTLNEYSYFSKYYPSLAFFQTIGDNIYRDKDNNHSINSVFENLGLVIKKQMTISSRNNSSKELLSDINFAIEKGQVVFASYMPTYRSKDGHEIVILSTNKNKQGEVVSYNIFDPNGISSKNIVSVNRLKSLIISAEFIDNDLTKI